MENNRWYFLRDEAVAMISDLETRLRKMTTTELEVVTARLAGLRNEIHGVLIAPSDRLEAENAELAGVPKFEKTYCSQCGGQFGPGNHGFSHCSEHRKASGDGGNGRVYNDLLAAIPEYPENGKW